MESTMDGVIGGGLVAGLVIAIDEWLRDGVLLADRVAEMFEALEVSAPSAGVLALNGLLVLAMGVVTVWLCAAVRPRATPVPSSTRLVVRDASAMGMNASCAPSYV